MFSTFFIIFSPSNIEQAIEEAMAILWSPNESMITELFKLLFPIISIPSE